MERIKLVVDFTVNKNEDGVIASTSKKYSIIEVQKEYSTEFLDELYNEFGIENLDEVDGYETAEIIDSDEVVPLWLGMIKDQIKKMKFEYSVVKENSAVAITMTNELDWHNDSIEFYVTYDRENDKYVFFDDGYIEREFWLAKKDTELKALEAFAKTIGMKVKAGYGFKVDSGFGKGMLKMRTIFALAKELYNGNT